MINPFTGAVHSVKYYPKPSKCSCPSSGLGFHILAVQMCLDEPDTDMKRKDKYSISILLKNKRVKEESREESDRGLKTTIMK